MDERLHTDIDYLNNEISIAKSHLKALEATYTNWVVSYCYVCNDWEKGYEGIPKGWAWSDGYLFCQICQAEAERRFPGTFKFETGENL